eukprot:CAMPEP_0194508312 /NCGR_PEP_ID=MMETSP0253-20130528/38431_1 /TAXON_ID=2966 /ORGANISM="Noctiluca scintillans" /LENGTH=216 /DNA_ID=CAMNT_0039351329 /DNA_START=72 /DNA_END=722 /DNA_ORIENTATION=+
MEPPAAPEAVKKVRFLWYLLMVMLVVHVICSAVALDIFGALMPALLAVIVYLMIKDDMRTLSQYILMFSILMTINCLFGVIAVSSMVGGRTTKTTEMTGSTTETDGTVVNNYQTSTKTTPFIDPSQGWFYNMQSISHIVAVVTCIFGSVLGLWCFCKVQEEMPDDEDTMGGFGMPLGRGASNYGGTTGGTTAGQAPRHPAPSFNTFQGRGQTLGSG